MTVGCHGELSSLVLRECGFELKRRLVAQRRVEALFGVDVRNEAIDTATSVSERITVTVLECTQFGSFTGRWLTALSDF